MKPPNNATRPPLLLLFLPPLSLSFVWHSHAHFICLNQGHTHCKWSIHTTWWALPTIWLLNGQEHKWHEAHYCNFVCPARVVPFAISLYWCLRWSATGSSCDKSMFEIKSATSTHRYMLWFRCMQQLWQTYFFCTSNSLLHKALFCSPLSPFFSGFFTITFVCRIRFGQRGMHNQGCCCIGPPPLGFCVCRMLLALLKYGMQWDWTERLLAHLSLFRILSLPSQNAHVWVLSPCVLSCYQFFLVLCLYHSLWREDSVEWP